MRSSPGKPFFKKISTSRHLFHGRATGPGEVGGLHRPRPLPQRRREGRRGPEPGLGGAEEEAGGGGGAGQEGGGEGAGRRQGQEDAAGAQHGVVHLVLGRGGEEHTGGQRFFCQ